MIFGKIVNHLWIFMYLDQLHGGGRYKNMFYVFFGVFLGFINDGQLQRTEVQLLVSAADALYKGIGYFIYMMESNIDKRFPRTDA